MKQKLFGGLYLLFGMLCGLSAWLLPQQYILVYQVWHLVTVFIWLSLAVMTIQLICKIEKLKQRYSKWKEVINNE